MKPILFYLPTQIAGIPFFGMGILFWLILLAGLFAVVKSLIQRKNLGDVSFYVIVTVLGLIIVRFIGPSLTEHEGFPIRGYGVFLTIAIALAGTVAIWRGKRMYRFPSEVLFSALFVSATFGIIGARIFYVLQYWEEFKSDNLCNTFLNAVNIANGGLVVYGSIIGGTVSGVIYLLIKRIPILPTLDITIPALLLGISIGRLGCLMNGCCFGSPCELPWAITFPIGSPAYMQQLDEGTISLYGITLAPPDNDHASQSAESRLFSLKSKHTNLASEIPSSIIIADVLPNSQAANAGLRPGDRICEIGLVAKSLGESEGSELNDAEQHTISRYKAVNNAQVFYFFLNIWAEDPEKDVWLLVQRTDVDNKEVREILSADPYESQGRPIIRNIIFHPNPSKTQPVHPTQIYSSISAFIIFIFLLFLNKYVKRDGGIFAIGALLYAINRFCLELIRTDEESFCNTGLTISQCISVCVTIGAVALLIGLYTRPPQHKLNNFFNEKSEESAKKNCSENQQQTFK